jgi:hypothetical protein
VRQVLSSRWTVSPDVGMQPLPTATSGAWGFAARLVLGCLSIAVMLKGLQAIIGGSTMQSVQVQAATQAAKGASDEP